MDTSTKTDSKLVTVFQPHFEKTSEEYSSDVGQGADSVGTVHYSAFDLPMSGMLSEESKAAILAAGKEQKEFQRSMAVACPKELFQAKPDEFSEIRRCR